MMSGSIESIVEEIASLREFDDRGRHALTLVQGRLHLARGPNASLELFIEGCRESFGLAAVGRSLEYGRYRDHAAGREFEALVVRSRSNDVVARMMAHLAYEAMRRVEGEADLNNAKLLEFLGPYIAMVTKRHMLSVAQQAGLVGELMMLLELLNYGADFVPGFDARAALCAWKGYDAARRDFSCDGIAVEAKATARDVRVHSLSSMWQPIASAETPDERVYIYSVGLRVDRSSPYSVVTAYDRVSARLSSEAQELFDDLVSQYCGVGFDVSMRSHYALEPGFLVSMAPEWYRVDNLDGVMRPSSFVGGEVPRRAKRIRYDLSLESLPALRMNERRSLLAQLLRWREV